MSKIVEIQNLSVRYDSPNPVLNKVNLKVYEKDFLGIIGPNGGGKTTLLKVIMGLVPYQTGTVTFYHRGEVSPRLNIGYMPQVTQIDKNFPISVHEVILSGLTPKHSILHTYSKEQKQHALAVAKQMGILQLLHRPIGKLSGGQAQRVLLARAIIDNPAMLILDEPSTYVDKKFEKDFFQILQEINQKIAIVMVSHDVGSVVSMVKNIACVNGTLHYHQGANISSEWIENSYTYPLDIVSHQHINSDVPYRVLHDHNHCHCQDPQPDKSTEVER